MSGHARRRVVGGVGKSPGICTDCRGAGFGPREDGEGLQRGRRRRCLHGRCSTERRARRGDPAKCVSPGPAWGLVHQRVACDVEEGLVGRRTVEGHEERLRSVIGHARLTVALRSGRARDGRGVASEHTKSTGRFALGRGEEALQGACWGSHRKSGRGHGPREDGRSPNGAHMATGGKPRRATGRTHRKRRVSTTDFRVEQSLEVGSGSQPGDDEGEMAGGDISTAAREGKALEGVASAGKPRPTTERWHGGVATR